eukprot:CAMPEP_0176432054 /NCGR_PEP_ID=MMETSP0127-20121128/15169_1 /TAXON_ID=938130 /ORGANISM="Platyophrya macrostoma, Strain WH" /LENGTH=239 /DNA_ID=CAMNT_0017814159 /DNA_START=58 /DNA_END=777 /DNA_ORIENTATION=-
MKRVLVFGSNGALGIDVVRAFAAKKWDILGADVAPPVTPVKNLMAASLQLQMDWSLEKMQQFVLDATADPSMASFDAVINVAGGWAGGSVADASSAAATELMIRQSVFTSIVASHITAVRGQQGAMLVLTGSAAAAQGGTGGMIGYGLAKAAVHHLVKSLASDPSKLPPQATVIGVLPITLDTPSNRACMPTADFSSWTPTTFAAEKIIGWSDNSLQRPSSGSLLLWRTEKGQTGTEVL